MKTGLVLEGGSMRGMFTSGVLDTFMDEGIRIDGIIGVSAGAVFGPNYFSGQKGRALRYNKRFCKNLRYMSIPSFLFTGNLVNRNFAFYDVTYKYDIFDNETFKKNNTGFYATVTNVETGKAEYIEITDVLEQLEVLRATSAIPFVSQIVELDGKKYLDGGVSDSIPVQKCRELGFDKIIVVLTRPGDYRKKPLAEGLIKLISAKYKKYPALTEALKNRHNVYNNTIDDLNSLSEKGEVFVIKPLEKINVNPIERSSAKLQAAYDMGIRDCKSSMDKLREYLKQD